VIIIRGRSQRIDARLAAARAAEPGVVLDALPGLPAGAA
jgi:hypothetical protein